MTVSIYEDDANVGELTRAAFEQTGSRLLQIHRLDFTDELHTAALLDVFRPAKGSVIADVGCGVGRQAELMKIQRPDLVFILVNKSQSQLDMCPARFTAIKGEAENLPIQPGLVDSIMITYVLGHLDLEKFVSECVRVKADKVYVYDLFKWDSGHKSRLECDLGYTARTVDQTIEIFRKGGLQWESGNVLSNYAPDEIKELMPNKHTLHNTISAAMVFKRQ